MGTAQTILHSKEAKHPHAARASPRADVPGIVHAAAAGIKGRRTSQTMTSASTPSESDFRNWGCAMVPIRRAFTASAAAVGRTVPARALETALCKRLTFATSDSPNRRRSCAQRASKAGSAASAIRFANVARRQGIKLGLSQQSRRTTAESGAHSRVGD